MVEAVTILLALAVAATAAFVLRRRLLDRGIVGSDLHKARTPVVPEMGGLAVVGAAAAGILFCLAARSFVDAIQSVDAIDLLAVLGTVLLAALIGLVDDLLDLHQVIKALLPLLAAVPLMAVRAGYETMVIPLVGRVDLSIAYPIVIIPATVAVASNGVNMLAGFNGLELGMGAVAVGSLSVIAWQLGQTSALLVSLAGLGAVLGVLPLNWYPARLFIGDVGTLSIGALIASIVIIGDFQAAAVILLIPYAVDFAFKAVHRFPSKGWGGVVGTDGKLHCPEHGPVGLCQFIMLLSRGLHERTLVLLLVGVEALLGVWAIALYVFR